MVNVGVAVGTSAWFLASADDQDALATVDLIARAADGRLELTKRENAAAEIHAAWQAWYGQALDSVRRLAVSGPSSAVDAAVDRARHRLSLR